MITFGLLVEDSKSMSATELAEELEDAASGESWSWVLWELNRAYFSIIRGSLELKGRASQIEDVTVISLGEAIESSEDSRARWLIPAKSSTGSVHELAQKRIRNFISDAYGITTKEDEESPFVKPKDRVLAPITSRRKFSGSVPGGAKRSSGGSLLGGSEDRENNSNDAPSTVPVSIPEGAIARKSRRGN